ncbi:MAG: phosphatidate cytidylyltransferase [Syntrophales bacterium]|nr:phosphatidate cytidylyltransferase [Syntrophales bacterium]
MNAHAQRWLTAIAAVPALFAIVYFGSAIVFSALILLVIVAGIFEYNALAFGGTCRFEKIEGLVLAFLIPIVFYLGSAPDVLGLLSLAFLMIFFLYIPRISREPFDLLPVMKVVFGFMYVPLMMSHLIWLRQADNGILWIFFVIVLAFSGDVAAFYIGRTFGKKKLLPMVSAGKSVEGTIALVAGSTVCCVIYSILFLPALPAAHAAALGFVGSVLGQLGDLCESVIKRAAGVKDSGVILPGHGGILDRLDCLIFIGPFTYYYKQFIIS